VELVDRNGPGRACARDLDEAAAAAGVECDDERRLGPLCTFRDEAELRLALLRKPFLNDALRGILSCGEWCSGEVCVTD
jgi:hypothetical protein